MQRTALYIFVFMALLSSFFVPSGAWAQLDTESGTIDVDLIVEGCNNNLICEAVIGEDTSTCPLDCPIPTPTPTPTSSAPTSSGNLPGNTRADADEPTVPLAVRNVALTTTPTSLLVQFDTNVHAIASLRVGQTALYEHAAVSEFGYRFAHELLIAGLIPNTRYLYELRVVSVDGQSYVHRGFFATDAPAHVVPVEDAISFMPVVGRLDAVVRSGEVYVSWLLPSLHPDATVQVVRTLNVPARTPADGITVYEGNASSVLDTGVVPGATYVYTAFVTTADGIVGDGVYIQFRYDEPEATTYAPDQFFPVFSDGTLEAFHITISQFGKPVLWLNKALQLVSDEDVLVRIPKRGFFSPLEHHQLIATIFDRATGVYREERVHVLAFSARTQSYETTLAPLPANSTVIFRVSRVRTNGTTEQVSFLGTVNTSVDETPTVTFTFPWLYLLILLLLAVLIFRIVFRMLVRR